ncbi:MAG: class I SAM-dependent methyltransferase [Candidatus Aenigmatarchaeota archaeon]
MNQREVWENIAAEFGKYRTHPMKDSAGFLENKKGIILDLACGSGRNFVKTDGTVVGVDFSVSMIKMAAKKAKKKNLEVLLACGDAMHLPFSDDSFDSVLFSSSFHCIKWNHRKKLLEEIGRVAKEGAPVFISVWNRDQPRFAGAKKESFIPWKSGGKIYKRYYYLYTKDELQSLLNKYFSSVRVFYSGDKAFKKYPKNIIAIAKVSKSGRAG